MTPGQADEAVAGSCRQLQAIAGNCRPSLAGRPLPESSAMYWYILAKHHSLRPRCLGVSGRVSGTRKAPPPRLTYASGAAVSILGLLLVLLLVLLLAHPSNVDYSPTILRAKEMEALHC